MDRIETLGAAVARLLLAVGLMTIAGCSMLTPDPVQPAPDPTPVVVADPEPAPVPSAEPSPAKKPMPEPPGPAEPPPARPVSSPVAVVISNRAPAFLDVANELTHYLDSYELYDLADRSLTAREAYAAIGESGARAIVAIGLPAARTASKFSSVPIVVSQVFNIQDAELRDAELKAVAVLPPMRQQVEAWLEMDPTIRNVGAVLGHGHEDLIAETEQTFRARGIKFHYAIANSDRETLYLFDRLVRDIDGFILFPDNRILSRNVLTEIMSTATRQRVQVAVFNEPLLKAGATFSSAAIESDIAATIVRVLNRIFDGSIDDMPPVSPLSEARITINQEMAGKLGLAPAFSDTNRSVAEAE